MKGVVFIVFPSFIGMSQTAKPKPCATSAEGSCGMDDKAESIARGDPCFMPSGMDIFEFEVQRGSGAKPSVHGTPTLPPKKAVIDRNVPCSSFHSVSSYKGTFCSHRKVPNTTLCFLTGA